MRVTLNTVATVSAACSAAYRVPPCFNGSSVARLFLMKQSHGNLAINVSDTTTLFDTTLKFDVYEYVSSRIQSARFYDNTFGYI